MPNIFVSSFFSHAVDQLSGSDEEVCSEVVESLLSTLKRLLCWFSCHGDSVSATTCFILLHKAYSFTAQPQHLVEVVSTFLSVSSKFEDLVSTFVGNATLHGHRDAMQFLESELNPQLHSLVHHVVDWVDSADQKIDTPTGSAFTQAIENSLTQIADSVEKDMQVLSENPDEEMNVDMRSGTDLMIQKQLVATSHLLLHAKLSLNSGQPATAAKYLAWCRIECKKFVGCLRFAIGCFNHVHYNDCAMQVDDMLTICLERLAVAFCLRGIRKKAEDYSVSAKKCG